MNDQTNQTPGVIDLRKVRLAFPDLWQPGAMKASKENTNPTAQFGATFLIPKGSAMEKEVWSTISEVARAKWGKEGDELVDSLKSNTQKFCFIDGDSIGKRKLDGFPGNFALSAKNRLRPGS